ncbi:hypothetical protein HanHA300_Chr04g0153561 [Helianthus annuus]|nr:hypothetical protein HanHA300_Chr04g0153561 [Helianthus annuus]KAJ0598542.1 hypothetical protein HanHA89_Chr04g0166951 [Helianthus annuus]
MLCMFKNINNIKIITNAIQRSRVDQLPLFSFVFFCCFFLHLILFCFNVKSFFFLFLFFSRL